MRFNANMLLLASYAAVASAMPVASDESDFHYHSSSPKVKKQPTKDCSRQPDGTKPECGTNEKCIANRCAATCTTTEGCAIWDGTACADVSPAAPSAPPIGAYCISKNLCGATGYGSNFYSVRPNSCKS